MSAFACTVASLSAHGGDDASSLWKGDDVGEESLWKLCANLVQRGNERLPKALVSRLEAGNEEPPSETDQFRHPGESRGPVPRDAGWIPASAGMTAGRAVAQIFDYELTRFQPHVAVYTLIPLG